MPQAELDRHIFYDFDHRLGWPDLGAGELREMTGTSRVILFGFLATAVVYQRRVVTMVPGTNCVGATSPCRSSWRSVRLASYAPIRMQP
jgi:hypothetical protein